MTHATRRFAERMTAAFAVAVLLVALTGLTAILAFRALTSSGAITDDSHLRLALRGERLRALGEREMAAGRTYALTGDAAQLAQRDAAHAQFTSTVQSMIPPASEASARDALESLVTAEQDQMLALERAAARRTVTGPVLTDGAEIEDRRNRLNRAADVFVQTEDELNALTNRQAIAAVQHGQHLVTLAAGAAMLIGAGMSILIARRFVRSYEQAQHAITARERFLSVASQELSRPLATLASQLEPLRHAIPTPPGVTAVPTPAQRVEAAHQQITRLSGLVGELVDATKMTEGRLPLQREPTDLVDVIRRVEHRLDSQLVAAHSSIALHTPNRVVGTWDRERLEQVVYHLLSNALRNSRGKIIKITIDPGDPVRLRVRDHGAGLSKEQAAHLFDAYEGASIAHQKGNLGLGLFIVRRIVEAHGGHIHVESTPELGATFTVELPRQPPVPRVARWPRPIEGQPSHA